MKPAKKIYVVLCLIALIAVACGPVTPVPTPVRTSTPALATRKPTLAIPTKTITATSTPTSTSPPQAEDYELQAWSASDGYYVGLAGKFSQEYYLGFNEEYQTYHLAFQAEKLLRDPSMDWHDTAWKIMARNPKGIPLPGMRPGQDLLAFLMEDILNNEKVKPEELPVIVKSRIRTTWECYSAQIVETSAKRGNYLIVNNLFGDQQDGWIFYTGNCEGTAVYALHKVKDQYQVEKMRDWQALEIPFAGYRLELDRAGDVNKNGIPEVIINVWYGASGTPPYSGQKWEFYEWDSSAGVFLSDSTEMFEDVCFSFETCDDGWRIETMSVQGVNPVIVKELHVIVYDELGEFSVCESLVLEHTYLWKSGKFSDQKQTLLPPTDTRIECRVSWAYQVLNRNIEGIDAAIQIISAALNDWPDSMNEMWGPASKDFFTLKLGLVYDMAGQEEQALTFIQDVAEHPANTEFDFIPGLAAAYLDVRSRQGKVQACREISLVQSESEYENSLYSPIYVPTEKIREIWGIGARLWPYGTIDDFCDGEDALQLLVRRTDAPEDLDVETWLKYAGVQALRVEQIHGTNAVTAWLVTVPTQSLEWGENAEVLERYDHQQTWLLARTSNGLDAIYVDDIDHDSDMSFDYLELNHSGLLVTVKTHGEDVPRFYIYHVPSNGEITEQLSDYYVDGFVNHKTNEITTIAESAGAEQPEMTVYAWNVVLGKFEKRIINFDFSKAQDEAEKLLFQERDYIQAILHIQRFLIQAPPEPKEFFYCQSNDCKYYPDWYRPYMRYLLALAYEMSVQPEPAREIYFALWKDYPDNIFGLAAEHRLVAVKP